MIGEIEEEKGLIAMLYSGVVSNSFSYALSRFRIVVWFFTKWLNPPVTTLKITHSVFAVKKARLIKLTTERVSIHSRNVLFLEFYIP